MRIECLKYLLDFAETGSVSTVAAQNFMTEQGMSRIFKQLENEMGVTLFQKSGKVVTLTSAGEHLVENSKSIVSRWERARRELECYCGQAQVDVDEVCLYATPLVMTCLIPLLDLQEPKKFDFPVNIHEIDLNAIKECDRQVAESRGLGLVSIPAGEHGKRALKAIEGAGLRFFPLLSSELVALVSSSSPLSRVPCLGEDKYRSRVVGGIGVACFNDPAVLEQITESVYWENLRLVTNNFQYIKQQIRSGQMTMFLPKVACANIHFGKGISVVPLATENHAPSVEFGLMLPCTQLSPTIDALAAFIQQEVTRLLESPGNKGFATLSQEAE